MKSFKLVAWAHPGEYVETPDPKPGPGEVLVRVKACGLCRSDVDMMDCKPGEAPYADSVSDGYSLGHEIAGYAEEFGIGVTDMAKGTPVAVHHMRHCGVCQYCVDGWEQNCEAFRRNAIGETRGTGLDGGLATFVVVPRAELVPLPQGADPVLYAPMTDAGVTAYATCSNFLFDLRPGQWAAIVGIGGLGAYGVQYVKKLTGARVIAIDNAPGRLQYAKDVLDADAVVLSDKNAAENVRKITDGRGVEGLADFVGSDETLSLAAAIVRPRGFISVAGMSGGKVELGWSRMNTTARFALSLGSSRRQLREVCQLVTEGRLHVDIDRFGWHQIPEAYEKLRKGQLKGRGVIVIDE